MNSKIVVVKKPDWVSWDEIHTVLWEAHQQNIKNGMPMRNPFLSGDELKQLVGDDGCCFVALDGKKVVGTAAYVIKRQNRWYTKGKKVAYLLLGAILPDYQGKGVYSLLRDVRQRHIDSLHVDLIEMETAEHNLQIQAVMQKCGFKYIGFRTGTGGFYYVVMAKWPHCCPYSDRYIHLRFLYTKIKTKCRYRKNGSKRFGV